MKAFSSSSSTSTAPHLYALLLGKMVAVDVKSFPYFRDERVVSVSYIYRTWKRSTSRACKAWPVQWLFVIGNGPTVELYRRGRGFVGNFNRGGTLFKAGS